MKLASRVEPFDLAFHAKQKYNYKVDAADTFLSHSKLNKTKRNGH